MALAGEIIEHAIDVIHVVGQTGVLAAVGVDLLHHGTDHLLIGRTAYDVEWFALANERHHINVEEMAHLGKEVVIDTLGRLEVLVAHGLLGESLFAAQSTGYLGASEASILQLGLQPDGLWETCVITSEVAQLALDAHVVACFLLKPLVPLGQAVPGDGSLEVVGHLQGIGVVVGHLLHACVLEGVSCAGIALEFVFHHERIL